MNLSELIKTQRKSYDSSKVLDILFATPDVAPFSSESTLAAVAQQLPKALSGRGHRVTIITPLYDGIKPDDFQLSKRLTTLSVKLGAKKKAEVTLWEKNIDLTVRVVFMDYPALLSEREDDSSKESAEMYSFFSQAVVAYVKASTVPFDVIHCNDWQTALIPELMKEEKINLPSILSIFDSTPGKFSAAKLKGALIPKKKGTSFLGSGVSAANTITTLSSGMKDLLLSEKNGVEKELKKKAASFHGILNGVSYSSWNSLKDTYLVHPFDLETLNGKRLNKVALQHQFGLPIRPTQPLVAFIGKLDSNSGVNLFIKAVQNILKERNEPRENLQVVFLAEGDKTHEKAISKLQKEFPNRVFGHFDINDELVHKFVASADILALTNDFESGGTIQMHALRYGTLPLVHKVGGLADTVIDADNEEGNGFVYEKQNVKTIQATIDRAIDRYRIPRQWRPLVMNAMNADFSWHQAAGEFEKVYFSSTRG